MRGLRLVAAAAVLVVAAGCSGIPTGGTVQQVREDDDLGQSTVRYAPAPPSPGATPQQVVSGYLDAMLAFPPSTGVAEQYLTQGAAERWNPAAATHVYRDPLVSAVRADRRDDGVQVELTARGVLDLDARGRVEPAATRERRSFGLQQVDGEWRISAPPEGLLVTEKFYTDYYRAFPVFFFDRSGERLAPSVVHLPAGEQLATSLVTSLARGPSDPTAQLRTYVPGLGDLRPSVPVDAEGVAEVDLGPEAAQLSVADQGRLAAQLVWTLSQVRDVTGVRVSAGATVLTPRGQRVQPVGSWRRYVPRAVESGPFAVLDGEDAGVVEIVGATIRQVPEAWDVEPDETAAIDVGPSRVATLSRSGDALVVRRTTGEDRVEVAVTDLVSARWLPDDVLVVVDRPGGGSRVRVVEPDATRSIPSAALASLDVTSFALSPDGSRYAITTAGGGSGPGAEDGTGGGGRVRIGAVERSADDRVVGLGASVALRWDVGRPASVAWVDGARLAFLADTDLGRQVFEGMADGTELEGGGAGGAPVLPDVGARTLVVAGEQRWAVDRRDRLWYLGPGATWTRLGVGAVSTLSPGV
ncbi:MULTISPECIES: GerMN domain-containing protein [unclassified Aeromicrobium]|uniref:GerMN domain-containing protein n=1 Tax=unclassified Aeromicrobium TaxID=2633570 RepID=UPI00288BE880|nr:MULTISPECIES: GerMN domain-containing protein [unclassified Aeromicrobium]